MVRDPSYFLGCSDQREVVSCVAVPAELSEYLADEPTEQGTSVTKHKQQYSLITHRNGDAVF